MTNFLAELKRRNVIRVALLYLVSSWLILQVADVLTGLLALPDWTLRLIGVILLLGLPFALIVSWVYEITPEGVRRESEVPRGQSVAVGTGRKLNIAIIVLLLAILAMSFFNRDSAPDPAPEAAPPAVADQAAAPERHTGIAVLPFANLSGDETALPFTNGLHDDLLTRLSRISGLRVISRTSVLEYQETSKNIRTIGEELGVSHLMEGGVQRAGNRVRINVQLIDAGSDEHLWADTFDRALTVENIFEIQTEIADKIANELKISLVARTTDALELPTDNLAAYEAFLRGRMEMEASDLSGESYDRAESFFKQAITLDPKFALAYAWLGTVWDYRTWFGGINREDRERVRDWAQKALALDPGLPEAHLAMASYYYHGYLDYERALESLTKAEEALSGDSFFLEIEAAVYRRSGDARRGAHLFEQALVHNPRMPLVLLDLIGSYEDLGRYRDAHAMVDRLERLNTPAERVAYLRGSIDWNRTGETAGLERLVDEHGAVEAEGLWISLRPILSALWVAGRGGEIDAYIDASTSGHDGRGDPLAILRARYRAPENRQALAPELQAEVAEFEARIGRGDLDPRLRLHLAEGLVYLGRFAESVEILNGLREDPFVIRDHHEGPNHMARAAFVYVLLDDRDDAIAALDNALAPDNALSLRAMMQNPGMDVLESHPGFPELVERHGWTKPDRSDEYAP